MPDTKPRADGQRVLADLNALRAIGVYKTGVHKPTFSEPHKKSLDWLVQKLPDAGLTAAIDGIGNVFGSSAKQGPKLLAGSHLESQNYAGWLDGPLGVVYALEAARVLNADPSVKGAVEVAAWCDEEGHFGHFLGSRSYVGQVTEADIDAARDRTSGRTMRDALADMGLSGRARVAAEPGRHVGYLEAHIEQGDTLESGKLSIGGRGDLHRRHLAVPDQFRRRAEPCRHHPHGGAERRRPRAGQVLRRDRRAVPGRLWPAHGLDHRPHDARSRRAEHHSGQGRIAVPDPRRRSGCDLAAGAIAADHG
ncbi:hypothetical protein ACVWXQ_004013 [Bradyrhizobium sp. S3.14.4]